MTDTSDILRQYYGSDPGALKPSRALENTYQDNPFAVGAAAPGPYAYQQFNDEARNINRPGPVTAPVEQTLEGMAQLPYDAGRTSAELGYHLYNKEHGPAAMSALELAAMLAPMPGKARLPIPREIPGIPARAKEMGFAPPVYYQGRQSPYPGQRPWQFVTDNREMASDFAGTRGVARPDWTNGHVLPLMVNRHGFADLTSKADLQAIAERLASRTPSGTVEEALQQLKDPSNIINGRVNWAVEPIMWAAKEAGFPGMHVHESWGKWGAPDSHSLAIFDPSRLRSVNAAFDPASKDSANLLASYAAPAIAAPTLASVLAQYGDEPDPTAPHKGYR